MKTCTIIHEPDGKWFASMVFEEVVPLQNLANSVRCMMKRPSGVDLGLLSLITTSEGEYVEHPRLLRKSERRFEAYPARNSRKREGVEEPLESAAEGRFSACEGEMPATRL